MPDFPPNFTGKKKKSGSISQERSLVTDKWPLFCKTLLTKHTIKIEDPEHVPFIHKFVVVAGVTKKVNLALDPLGKEDVQEIVIKTKRLEAEVSDTVIEVSEVKKIPGTQGDIIKIVQSLPGVARSAAGAGAAQGIVVRGSAPEDSKVLIDGFVVPALYHFGGLKSVLNSDMLKRIELNNLQVYSVKKNYITQKPLINYSISGINLSKSSLIED